MLSTILLQAAAGMGIAKMGATIGAGFAAIGAVRLLWWGVVSKCLKILSSRTGWRISCTIII